MLQRKLLQSKENKSFFELRAEYNELMIGHASSKEFRRLHKQIKKYGYKVPFHKRYQELPTIISVIALLGSIFQPQVSQFLNHMISLVRGLK